MSSVCGKRFSAKTRVAGVEVPMPKLLSIARVIFDGGNGNLPAGSTTGICSAVCLIMNLQARVHRSVASGVSKAEICLSLLLMIHMTALLLWRQHHARQQ